MVASFMPSLAFATVDPADRLDHVHNWSATLQNINLDKDGKIITSDVSSRCDYTMYKAYVCSCGEYKDAVLVGEAQHNYVKSSKSNCVETWDEYKCSKCGDTYKENVKPVTDGKHTLSATRVQKSPATCTENEVRAYKCSVCGEYVDAIEVPETKLGHDIKKPTTKADGTVDYSEATSTVPATCMAEGKYVYKCSRCDAKEEYVIAKTAHTYKSTPDVIKVATCDSAEISAYCCSVAGCPAYKSAFESAPAKAHTFGAAVVTKATCDKDGSEVKTCSACGAKEEKVIPATGHKFGPARTQVSPATCTEDEVLAYKCTNAGCDAYSDPVVGDKALGHKKADEISTWTYIKPSCTENAFAAKLCDRTGCGEIVDKRELVESDFASTGIAYNKALEATGHAFVLKDVVDATCAKAGTKTYKCECGETKVETITKLPHTIVNDAAVAATSTKTGLTAGQHCSVCNEVVVAQKVTVAKAKAPIVKAAKKSLTVTASKVTGATKYQVAYRQSGKSWKYATASTKNAQTIKSLKSGKKYYVKVRTISGSVKGAWSSTKSVKVK